MPGIEAELLAADPRQRPREHFADRRPDRDQDVRRRPRRAARTRRERCSTRSRPVPGRRARLRRSRRASVPQLQIEIDRARAARYGLNVADIEDVIETALGGRAATRSGKARSSFSVVVRLREDERRLDAAARDPAARRARRLAVPLAQVADVQTAGGSMNISRENGGRVTAIGVFIPAATWAAWSQEMQQRVAAEGASCRPATRSRGAGEFENQQRAMARLS